MEAKRCTYPNQLPNDIFLVILSRLPVKTLLRFRSVSKHFNSLIADPSLARMHLQRQNLNINYNNVFLQISSNPPDKKKKRKQPDSFSLVRLHDDDVSRPFDITECPRPEYHKVLATCDGVVLLCDYSHDALMLWNPFTRKETIFWFPRRFSTTRSKHALYHDPDTGDFKVVVASSDYFAVYSCNDQSWTGKNKLPHHIPSKDTWGAKAGVFVDGAIYWITHEWVDLHHHSDGEIVYLDTRDNEFKKLEKPDFCKAEFKIVELRGCLSLYQHTRSDKTAVQIWIKEKGVDRNGWDELMMIENVEEPSEWFRVVCLLDNNNNKVLLQLRERGGFVVYSAREKTFAGFGELYDPLFRVQLVPCRESMLFPLQDNLKRSKRKRSQTLKLKI